MRGSASALANSVAEELGRAERDSWRVTGYAVSDGTPLGGRPASSPTLSTVSDRSMVSFRIEWGLQGLRLGHEHRLTSRQHCSL